MTLKMVRVTISAIESGMETALTLVYYEIRGEKVLNRQIFETV